MFTSKTKNYLHAPCIRPYSNTFCNYFYPQGNQSCNSFDNQILDIFWLFRNYGKLFKYLKISLNMFENVFITELTWHTFSWVDCARFEKTIWYFPHCTGLPHWALFGLHLNVVVVVEDQEFRMEYVEAEILQNVKNLRSQITQTWNRKAHCFKTELYWMRTLASLVFFKFIS